MSCMRHDCKYKGEASKMEICDYIGHTGKPRGCPTDNCNKYEKQYEPRKKKQIFIEPPYENWI